MTENSITDKDKLKEKWMARIQDNWPAIKGSLAHVNKPCIRKNCEACASGRKHPTWLLAVVVDGRRTTLYVPESLVGAVKQAIKNGRKIEDLLQKEAVQMIKNNRIALKKSKI